jgi:hypothetical protein
MCNIRTISETITGAATDALERSMKRRRIEEPMKNGTLMDNAFFLNDIHNDLLATEVHDEGFPSIEWSFDESDSEDSRPESQDNFKPSTPGFFLGTKQGYITPCLRRSKSFRTDLSQMIQRTETLLAFREATREPFCIKLEETKISPIYPIDLPELGFATKSGSRIFHSKLQRKEDDEIFHHQKMNIANVIDHFHEVRIEF